jgi:hypothetical protein
MPPSGAVSSASATRTRVRSSPSTTSKKGWYTGEKVMIPVSRMGERLDGDGDRRHDARHDDHVTRIDLPAVAPVLPRGEGGTEAVRNPGVPEDGVLEAPGDRGHDLGSHSEIHVRDPHGNLIRAGAVPLEGAGTAPVGSHEMVGRRHGYSAPSIVSRSPKGVRDSSAAARNSRSRRCSSPSSRSCSR